jgi:hypothetical protein
VTSQRGQDSQVHDLEGEETAPSGRGEFGGEVLRAPDLFHRAAVRRSGEVVVKETGPWAATVRSLLHHLHDMGFAWSPRPAGSEFDRDGRQTISYFYIEGEFTHYGPWSLEGAAAGGATNA